MTSSADDKRDFFVSFNQADRPWAAWIVRVLREEGYSLWLPTVVVLKAYSRGCVRRSIRPSEAFRRA
jgi:hypothetical protein